MYALLGQQQLRRIAKKQIFSIENLLFHFGSSIINTSQATVLVEGEFQAVG